MRRQDIDPTFQKKLQGLTARLLFVSTDCPGNEDRQLALNIEKGRFNEILVSAKPAPSDLRTAPFDHTRYSFRVIAPEQTLIEMINGRAELLDVMGKIKIDGDLGIFMAQVQGFIGFVEYLSTMGIEP
jgi:hypothetical protein